MQSTRLANEIGVGAARCTGAHFITAEQARDGHLLLAGYAKGDSPLAVLKCALANRQPHQPGLTPLEPTMMHELGPPCAPVWFTGSPASDASKNALPPVNDPSGPAVPPKLND